MKKTIFLLLLLVTLPLMGEGLPDIEAPFSGLRVFKFQGPVETPAGTKPYFENKGTLYVGGHISLNKDRLLIVWNEGGVVWTSIEYKATSSTTIEGTLKTELGEVKEFRFTIEYNETKILVNRVTEEHHGVDSWKAIFLFF